MNDNEILLYGKRDEEEFRTATIRSIENVNYQIEAIRQPGRKEDAEETAYSDISKGSPESPKTSEKSHSDNNNKTLSDTAGKVTNEETITTLKTAKVKMTREKISVSRTEKVTYRTDHMSETDEWDKLVRDIDKSGRTQQSLGSDNYTTPSCTDV